MTIVETKNLGVLSLKNSRIKSFKEIKEVSFNDKGQVWFRNPNATRYLFAPSAIPLKKGEGYYQNFYILGNAVNYGITDNFSLGGVFLDRSWLL